MAVSDKQQDMPTEDPPLADDYDEEPDDDDYEDFDDEEEEEEDEDEDEDDEPVNREARMRAEKAKMENLFRRISTERVPLRVHDVIIKGNTKTKEYLIEAELEGLKNAASVQELLRAASIANAKLRQLEIFDSINITLDSGPPELPGTTNVIVEVAELNNPLTGDLGMYAKPEAGYWGKTVEGSLKLKNVFGYGDLWDASLAYGWDLKSEISAGLYIPRFKKLATPVMARVSLFSQDWLKFSSYKERTLGLSLGLWSSKNHDLSCNLSWRTLTDPSQMSSRSVRGQLGHGLVSALKYTFKIDKRNSPMRPTQGYGFVSTTQLGGLLPDFRSIRFLRQEFDVRCALPLGYFNAALNFGAAAGALFPLGSGFLNSASYLPERFFLGGHSSPVCSLGGPAALLGFKTRGLGPFEPRRHVREDSAGESSDTCSGVDFLGGDLALTAFADLSFDLPLKVLREAGVHGHAFACTGSLNKLTENAFQDMSFQKFRDSFRSSVGLGIVIPTGLFRMEVNYCYILKKHEHDQGKSGIQFSFSSPRSWH